MPNALDAFREQRAAVDSPCAQIQDVSALIGRLQNQVNALSRIDELRTLLQQEQSWLEQAQRTIEEARTRRQLEMQRFWPNVWRRCAVALVFALASAAGAGAGHAPIARPWTAELIALRARSEFAEFVEQRVVTMTPAERRQFDALMRWNAPPKR